MRILPALLLSASLLATTAFAQNTTLPVPAPGLAPLFSTEEGARIVGFWNESGRYRAEPDVPADGKLWVTRLTPAASVWFRSYTSALSQVALPPGQNAVAQTPTQQKWENWVQAKLAHDSWTAQQSADRANSALAFATTIAPVALPATPLSIPPAENVAPPHPGVMPDDLRALTGNAPALRAAVAPWKFTVNFPDGDSVSYRDHVKIGNARYGYYRFDEGVQFFGPALRNSPPAELQSLLEDGGFTPFEARVTDAVSRLEGGFGSVNTYDTGWVSVGFIQFASLSSGGGALGELMKVYKSDDAQAYARDFRQYGIDVDDQGLLVALDPATGAELHGPDANRAIIADKRLIAVWQHAGLRSREFQLAQLKAAKTRFYPADRPLQISLAGGQVLTGKVSDVVHSQAGMATLFDRSVNTGNINLFGAELQKLMTQKNLSSLEEAAKYERELIQKVKWRVNFLQDQTLSQPR